MVLSLTAMCDAKILKDSKSMSFQWIFMILSSIEPANIEVISFLYSSLSFFITTVFYVYTSLTSLT